MAVIHPAPGELKNTARMLLLIAGDTPEIVRTVNAGNAFDVPDALADAYHAAVTENGPRSATGRRTARRTKE